MTDPVIEKVVKYIRELPEFDQRQDTSLQQLRDLAYIANSLKLYDAADVLSSLIALVPEKTREVN